MRKLRKFVHSPKKFFIDSKVLSWFLKNIIKEKINPQLNINYSDNERVLGSIPLKDRVNIKSPPSKPAGWVSVLVYKIEDHERVDELYEKLTSMADFSPFSRKNLKILSIDIDPDEGVLSIINRIDFAVKNYLSLVSNYIFLDAPVNIIEAIRVTSPYIKTIVVRTEYSESHSFKSTNHIDALISSIPSDLEIPGLRRVNYFSSIDSLSQMLRKVVQETGPKLPDMLISLIGCLDYSEEYLSFDSSRYQGIIYVKCCANEKSRNFTDYLNKFSQNIIGMMVVESVYMRYRGICELIEVDGNPTDLLRKSLFDGVIFDVREIK